MKQTQQFTEDGKRVPVTFISANPCWVTQIVETGTTRRVQLGFGITKKLHKSQEGMLKKAGLDIKPRFLRLVKAFGDDLPTVGAAVTVDSVFQIGDQVRVTGISKGKGFAGVVKRHGFKGGPRTHGQSDRERSPGSIGQTTTPGRVYKGKRMAGRMGNDRVTVRGLSVIGIDTEKNILIVKGLVPGHVNGLLEISKE